MKYLNINCRIRKTFPLHFNSYFLLNDQVQAKFFNKKINKNLSEFHFDNTELYVDIINKFIMERFRSKCYVAGGVFTKYNKKYENIFPIAFNYFSPKHDTDIYILHSTIFSSGILDSFRNQIIEEHDCQYDENIVTINKSIHKTVKL